MTITVANVDQTTDSFGGWIAKTNQIADALTTKVVTTDSNTATGNAAISNSFRANAVYANTVYGGNVTTGSANLAIGSNVYFTPFGSANVLVIVGNSSTGSFATTLTGNNVTISPANTLFNGTRINVAVSNVSVNASTFKVIANTTLSGNTSVNVVTITGNSTTSNLDILADTVKITGIANVIGNTTIQANSTLNNIKVVGNGTISNVTITANDVYLTPSSNVNVTAALYVTNTVDSGNTTVTGFVNASASVNSAIITVGTNLIANSSGVYHTGTVNAASLTTTGVTANTTGVYPTSNTSGATLGTSARRFSLSANTVDASGLITGGNGLDITGTANVSATLNVGANNTLNATAHLISTNSTVNTVITATSITQSNTTATPLIANVSGIFHTGTVNAASFTTSGTTANAIGVYPTSNTSGQNLGSTTARYVLSANTIDASGLITGSSGATITGQTNTTTLGIDSAISANSSGIYPASNTSGQNIGNTTARVAVSANSISASGPATISNTLAAGNTTITGFANVSTTLRVGGNTTLAANLVLGNSSVAVAIIANGSPGSTSQFLLSNGSATYWETITNVNVVNNLISYTFSNTIVIDRSANPGDNEFLVKSQNTSAITIQGDSTALGTGADSGAYLRLGTDGVANIGLLSIIQGSGNNGMGGSYTDSLADSVLLGSVGARNLQFGTQNAVVATITAGGNTGFGNTAPAHKVRVEGTFSALTSVQVASAFTANGSGMFHTGSVNAAAATLGSAVANATGLYTTGLVNAASYNTTGFTANASAVLLASNSTVNTIITPTSFTQANTTATPFVANVTGLYHTGVVNAASHTTSSTTSNTSGFFPASNTSGMTLGNTLARWVITANSVAASGNVTAAGFQYSNGASVGIIIYNADGTQVFP